MVRGTQNQGRRKSDNLRCLWYKGKSPKSLDEKECLAIKKLFLEQTGENYALPTIKTMPIPEWDGNLVLAQKDEKYPQKNLKGILWTAPFKEEIVRVVAFAIDDDYQNEGWGSLAWEIFRKAAKEKGFKFVQLEVRAKNILAQNFYKKRGLVVQEVLSGYYSDDLGYSMKGKL